MLLIANEVNPLLFRYVCFVCDTNHVFPMPYTSKCTSSSKSWALPPFALKALLVILPTKQDSQVGNL